MAFQNNKMSANELGEGFNWDEIDVGNLSLDHSQNFFARVHLEHEKAADKEKRQKQLEAVGLVKKEVFNSSYDFDADDKENKRNGVSLNVNCEIGKSLENKDTTAATCKIAAEQQQHSAIFKRTANVASKELNEIAVKNEYDDTTPKKVPTTACTEQDEAECSEATRPPNVQLAFSVQKNKIPTNALVENVSTPKAYKYMNVYQKRKEENRQRLLKEEQEKRLFHSRPLPNFKACHQQLAKKTAEMRIAITVPKTPMVVKHSREMEERRMKKQEELIKKQQVPKAKARDAAILREEPFVPKKEPLQLELKPFRLRSEQRVKERRQFDEATERAREEKAKQVIK